MHAACRMIPVTMRDAMRVLRALHGKRQIDVGRTLRVDRSTVSRMERGLTKAGVKKVEQLITAIAGGPMMDQISQEDLDCPLDALNDEAAAIRSRIGRIFLETRAGLIDPAQAEIVQAKLLARVVVILAAIRLRIEASEK